MNEEEIQRVLEENKLLKITIQQLRKQLEAYKNQSRKQYDLDRDYLPFHEHDRD